MRKERYVWELQKISTKGRVFHRQVTDWDHNWSQRFAVSDKKMAETLLDKRLDNTAIFISRALGHSIQQEEFDSIVSWAEPLSSRQILSSRVWNALTTKKWRLVGPAMNQWVSQNGTVDPLLVSRRREESRLYEFGYLR